MTRPETRQINGPRPAPPDRASDDHEQRSGHRLPPMVKTDLTGE